MAEFERLDQAAGSRGRRAYATPHAVGVRFDRRTGVSLDTGIDFAFDPKRAQGLAAASAEDLVGVTVEGVGGALSFPRLDADFTVSRLLEGFLRPLDWTRREARAFASRENGKRGGRARRAAIARSRRWNRPPLHLRRFKASRARQTRASRSWRPRIPARRLAMLPFCNRTTLAESTSSGTPQPDRIFTVDEMQ